MPRDYSLSSNEPNLVIDPVDGYYRALDLDVTWDNALTALSVPGLATMTDSSGNVVWNAHNFAVNSASPATQSITVVSGVDYTVELTGTGSITLSGAGTGTVTEGSPVEVTASTTSLTLTVSGTVDTMWAYRSDLGGMANAPGRSDTYLATTTTARFAPRISHHKYLNSTWTNTGILFDPKGATQLFENTDGGLGTQNVTVTAQSYTVHFTGTGTITFSGAHTGSLVGTGTGEENRVSTTFTPSAGTVTCTVSGTVTDAQFEAGDYRTAYIPNTGTGTVARLAEELGIANADLDLATDAISVVVHLYASYSDNNDSTEIGLWSINKDSNERHQTYIGTDSTRTGRVTSQYRHNNAINAYTANNTYSPGYHVAMNTAVRHDLNGSTGTSQVAADGTAGTAATGTANDIEDTADLVFGEINGTVPSEQGEMVISLVTMFDVDIGEAGIETASDSDIYPTTEGGGGDTITGSDFDDSADTFGSGTLSLGAVTITGSLFADTPDTFGAGTITQGGIIGGNVYADPDSFGAGALLPEQLLSGGHFDDSDTFGAGELVQDTIIQGTLFSDPDSFGAGDLVKIIGGTVHADGDSFGSGILTTGSTTIVGGHYNDPDFFGGEGGACISDIKLGMSMSKRR